MNMSVIDNQAAANRFVLNVTPAGEQGVKFNQGEILKGVVQEIKSDGTISLAIKGKLVDAVSEVKVSPGQQLYLLVDSFKNGLTYLKVVTAQGLTQIENNNIMANLRNLGIPSNADTVLIARKLMQHNLPVTQQTMQEVIKAMNILGGNDSRNLEVAAFALKNNIPLDKNILPIFNQFITSDGDLARSMRELNQVLARVETIAQSGSFSSNQSSALISSNQSSSSVMSSSAISVNAVLSGASLAGDEPTLVTNLAPNAAGNSGNQTILGNMANLSQQNSIVFSAAATQSVTAGTNPEAAVIMSDFAMPGTVSSGGGTISADNPPVVPVPASATAAATSPMTAAAAPALTNSAQASTVVASSVPAGNTAANGPNSAPPPILTGTGGETPPSKPNLAQADTALMKDLKPMDLTEVVKILRAVLDSAVGKMGESSLDTNSGLTDLVKNRALLADNLRWLQEIIKNNEMLFKNPAGQELLAKISELQQQVTGQAVFNTVTKLSQDVFMNNYYFSFPVEIDKQQYHCQLRVQKNTRSQLNQQDNVKLVVSLDTPALGIIMFHIDWYRQRYIQLQGVVETKAASGFIEKNVAELIQSLTDLGYRVNHLGIKVAKEPEELILKPLIKEAKQDAVRPFGIDVIA